jgi:hypothetical protein
MSATTRIESQSSLKQTNRVTVFTHAEIAARETRAARDFEQRVLSSVTFMRCALSRKARKAHRYFFILNEYDSRRSNRVARWRKSSYQSVLAFFAPARAEQTRQTRRVDISNFCVTGGV